MLPERQPQKNIHFEAFTLIPKELSIPESDLCSLLINMLNNALEACTLVEEPEKRFVHFRSEIKKGFLTIQCENSFSGEITKIDRKGFPSTKDDSDFHGFGIPQMSAVAKKYKSMLVPLYRRPYFHRTNCPEAPRSADCLAAS